MTAHTAAQPGKSRRLRVMRRQPKPYVHPYLAGILLGLVLFAAFFFTGNGLGASGGVNRIVVFFEDLLAPQHVDRTAYLLEMGGGSGQALDSWIVFITIGTMIGGFLSGWANGRRRLETNRGPNVSVRTRWMVAFLGGT